MTRIRKQLLTGLVCVITLAVVALFTTTKVTDNRRSAAVEKLRERMPPGIRSGVGSVPGDAIGAITKSSEETAADYERLFERVDSLYSTWEDFRESKVLTKPAEAGDAEWALLEAFLSDHQNLLDDARRMAEKGGPVKILDLREGFHIELLHLGQIRQLTRLLRADALLEVRAGNDEKAVEDILAGMKLGDALAHEPLIISQLVRFACYGIMMETFRDCFSGGDLSPELTQHLMAQLTQADNREALAHVCFGESFIRLGVFDQVRSGPSGRNELPSALTSLLGRLYGSPLGRPWFNLDEENYAGVMGKLAEVARLPLYQAQPELDRLKEAIEALPRTRLLSRTIILDGHLRTPQVQARHEASLDILQMGLLLEQYSAAHDAYPKTLDAIAPQLGGNVPVDPHTGESYYYRPCSDSFLLYSVAYRKQPAPRDIRQYLVWRGRTSEVVTESLQQFGLGTLQAAACSPHGQHILTAGARGAFMWDTSTGDMVRAFPSRTEPITSVTFSPDGTRILTVEGSTATLWDSTTGEEVHTFSHLPSENLRRGGFAGDPDFLGMRRGWGSPMAFSPDSGRILSGATDGTVKLWDAATGEELRDFDLSRRKNMGGGGQRAGTAPFAGLQQLRQEKGVERTTSPGPPGFVPPSSGGHPPATPVYSVMFSPDETHVLTVEGSTATLWDITTGEELHRFCHSPIEDLGGGLRGTPVGRVYSVAFSPDGKQLVTGGSASDLDDPQSGYPVATAILWDVATGEKLRVLRHRPLDSEPSFWCSVSFSSDGRRVLAGSARGTVKVWDTGTGKELESFATAPATRPGLESDIIATFSPDGARFLTWSTEGAVRLWDSKSGEQIQTFIGHAQPVHFLSFSRDGSKVLIAEESSARTELREMRANGGYYELFQSPVNEFHSGTVKLWDGSTGEQLWSPGVFARALLSSEKSKLVTVSLDPVEARDPQFSLIRGVKPWDAATGEELGEFSGLKGRVCCMTISPDGSKICAFDDDGAKVWNATDSPERSTSLRGCELSHGKVAFSPDGTRLLTGDDDTLKLWDSQTGEELKTLAGHAQPIRFVTFSPDGARFLTASWRSTGGALQELRARSTGVRPANKNPLRRFLGRSPLRSWRTSDETPTADATAELWDTATGQKLQVFTGFTGALRLVEFSPDGRRVVVVGTEGTVKLWDVNTGKELIATTTGVVGRIPSGGLPVRPVAFSPDSARTLVSQRDGAMLWDADTGEALQPFIGHTSTVCIVVFSPDGTRVVTASEDGTVKIWNAESGEELRTLAGHTSYITAVAFSPDGTQLLTGSEDGTALLWDAVQP